MVGASRADITEQANSVFAQASSNFGSTVTLPLSGDVFVLPEGYTVNSAEASIVDNRFVGIPLGASAAPALPPWMLGLLAVLLVGATVGALRRRARPECSSSG